MRWRIFSKSYVAIVLNTDFLLSNHKQLSVKQPVFRTIVEGNCGAVT